MVPRLELVVNLIGDQPCIIILDVMGMYVGINSVNESRSTKALLAKTYLCGAADHPHALTPL